MAISSAKIFAIALVASFTPGAESQGSGLATDLCDFQLNVINQDFASLGTSTISLNQEQLAGTQSANLALALIPGTLDIAATIQDCAGGEYTAMTTFEYASGGGTQQVTLIAIKTSVNGTPLLFEADFRPIITTLYMPFKIGHEVTNVIFNAADFGANSGIYSAQASSTCGGIEIETKSLFLGQLPNEAADIPLNFTKSSFSSSQTYPVACQVEAIVTDITNQQSDAVTQSLIVDPQEELKIEAVTANPPAIDATNLLLSTVPLNGNNMLTVTVEDYDLGRSSRNDVVTGWSEQINCRFSIGTKLQYCSETDCIPFDCAIAYSVVPTSVPVPANKQEFNFLLQNNNIAPGEYGGALCEAVVTCEDNTKALGDLYSQPVANQSAQIITAVFLVNGVETAKNYDTLFLQNLYMVNSVYDKSKPMQLYYTTVVSDGDGDSETTNTGFTFADASSCSFNDGEFQTSTSCLNPYVTSPIDGGTQFSLSGDQVTAGTHKIHLVVSYPSGFRVFELPVSYTVDSLRARKSRRQAIDLDTTSFSLTVANETLVVDIASARNFNMTLDMGNGQDQDAGSPTPPPTEMTDSENKRVEIWVLAVIATGSLLLVIVGIVAVIIMKRDKARQSAKVMPFWEQAAPQYHPGQTKTINGNSIDSSSF